MFGALKRGFRSMASLILVSNVVGELQPKRTLAASRGFLAAARLSCCSDCHGQTDRRTDGNGLEKGGTMHDSASTAKNRPFFITHFALTLHGPMAVRLTLTDPRVKCKCNHA